MPKSLNEGVVKVAASAVPTDGNVKGFKATSIRLGSKLTSLVVVEHSLCRFTKRKARSRGDRNQGHRRYGCRESCGGLGIARHQTDLLVLLY